MTKYKWITILCVAFGCLQGRPATAMLPLVLVLGLFYIMECAKKGDKQIVEALKKFFDE